MIDIKIERPNLQNFKNVQATFWSAQCP